MTSKDHNNNHHHHHQSSSHHHHHHFESTTKLYFAVIINLVLTLVQIIGGVLSGSLSLVADAIHNLSDAGSLIIAAIAAKISSTPANHQMTYGYKRAEILGALINSTTLAIVGMYLIYESVIRYFNQKPIDGWIVIYIAGVALVIDLFTVFLTFSGSKKSLNIKAAFIHNLSDAAASLLVIVSGVLIIQYKIYVVDLIASLIISIYVLYHSYIMLKQCVLILMQSTPRHLDIQKIKSSLEDLRFINEAHHIHIWQLDDSRVLLEVHLVIDLVSLEHLEEIKKTVRDRLESDYNITHCTLEIEVASICPMSESSY